jgi:hypothetical protein
MHQGGVGQRAELGIAHHAGVAGPLGVLGLHPLGRQMGDQARLGAR